MTAAKPDATPSFTVDAKALAALLATLLPVTGKETIPILKTCLLGARDGRLAIAATDMDCYVRGEIAAAVEGSWSGCVDLRLLAGIAAKASGEIACAAKGERLVIHYERVVLTLACLPATSFPSPLERPAEQATVATAALVSALSRTLPIVSDEAYRTWATQGVSLVIGDEVEVAATDGRRIAVAGTITEPSLSLLLPRKAAAILAKLLRETDAETVAIGATDNLIGLTIGTTRLISRQLVGQFPPFAAEMQKQTVRDKVVLDRTAVIAALERLAYLNDGLDTWLRWEFGAALTISGQRADVGDGQAIIACEYSGTPVAIGLPTAQVLDGLRCVDDTTIECGFDGAIHGGGACIFFRAANYTYMIVAIQPTFVTPASAVVGE